MLEHTKLRHFWAQIVSWAPIHARDFCSLGPECLEWHRGLMLVRRHSWPRCHLVPGTESCCEVDDLSCLGMCPVLMMHTCWLLCGWIVVVFRVERGGSSAVKCQTLDRENPGSNPPLLLFRSLDIFVLATTSQFTRKWTPGYRQWWKCEWKSWLSNCSMASSHAAITSQTSQVGAGMNKLATN